jgi:hypothetical protein
MPVRISVSMSRSSNNAASGVPKKAECLGLSTMLSSAAGSRNFTSAAPARRGSTQRDRSAGKSLRHSPRLSLT